MTSGGGWAAIPAMTDAAGDRFGDALAVLDGETSLSYAELRDAARGFGAALLESGIEPGDRVAVWTFNSAEWIIAALGILYVGAVLVPVNTRFKGVEAADIVVRTRARALVTVTDFLGVDYVGMLRSAGVDLPDLETTVVARGTVPVGAVGWTEFVGRATGGARRTVQGLAAAVGPDDVSDILFTSGTTGRAKGVVQTHGRTLRVATDWAAMTGLTAGDRYLMVNPYFHMFGLKAGILASIAAGATMLPEAVFDVDHALTRVGADRVTVLPGAPTIYQAILDHPDRDGYDLSTLRVAVTGAADIPVELVRRICGELPFRTVITGYGLTEAGTATASSPGDDAETVATTVGRPRPGFALRVVDKDNREVPGGEAGEILLRGGSVMSHYLDDPAATAEAVSPEGWLRTGDLGVIDPNGCLRIVGRAKDMFIVGGFNAYPAEIEGALLHHPDVHQAAVIGVPDQRLGEVGMAFVVSRPDATISPDEIISWCRERMANYKVPRVVELVDALPVNATGKVVKAELRDKAASRATKREDVRWPSP